MVVAAQRSEERAARDFDRFHAENPAVYEELRELALEHHKLGRRRGIRAIIVLREVLAAMRGTQVTKVSLRFAVFYRTMLAENELRLKNFFLIRHHRKLEGMSL
jgi:hypothetical protein